MNIFSKMMGKMFPKDKGTAIPGAMGDLLVQLGIHELGPPMRSGTPTNVLMGCKKGTILIPGATRPAFTKEGKPVMAKTKDSKGGRKYQVQDNMGMSVAEWKSRVKDQERKANNRWFSGEPADVRAKRLKVVE